MQRRQGAQIRHSHLLVLGAQGSGARLHVQGSTLQLVVCYYPESAPVSPPPESSVCLFIKTQTRHLFRVIGSKLFEDVGMKRRSRVRQKGRSAETPRCRKGLVFDSSLPTLTCTFYIRTSRLRPHPRTYQHVLARSRVSGDKHNRRGDVISTFWRANSTSHVHVHPSMSAGAMQVETELPIDDGQGLPITICANPQASIDHGATSGRASRGRRAIDAWHGEDMTRYGVSWQAHNHQRQSAVSN